MHAVPYATFLDRRSQLRRARQARTTRNRTVPQAAGTVAIHRRDKETTVAGNSTLQPPDKRDTSGLWRVVEARDDPACAGTERGLDSEHTTRNTAERSSVFRRQISSCGGFGLKHLSARRIKDEHRTGYAPYIRQSASHRGHTVRRVAVLVMPGRSGCTVPRYVLVTTDREDGRVAPSRGAIISGYASPHALMNV